jgi:hypothetical protein
MVPIAERHRLMALPQLGASLGAPAKAGYVVDLTQEVIGGVNDVVANGSGPIDLTGLTSPGGSSILALLDPERFGDRDRAAFGHFLILPLGYVSGSPLSDISTYSGQTFASLGVTPGVYETKWGTGPNQNFTLKVGTIPAPVKKPTRSPPPLVARVRPPEVAG